MYLALLSFEGLNSFNRLDRYFNQKFGNLKTETASTIAVCAHAQKFKAVFDFVFEKRPQAAEIEKKFLNPLFLFSFEL